MVYLVEVMVVVMVGKEVGMASLVNGYCSVWRGEDV